MQTFLVHNRRPLTLMRELGLANFLALEIYVSGLILTPPLHTLYLVFVVVHWSFFAGAPTTIDAFSLIEIFTFVTGYLSAIALSVFGLVRIGRLRLVPFQILLPIYWALMGVASFRAAYELVRIPHFWSKTSHGLSRQINAHRRAADDPAPESSSAGSGDSAEAWSG